MEDCRLNFDQLGEISDSERVSMIQDWIIVHSILYYVMDRPVITDRHFDCVARQLVEEMEKADDEDLKATKYWYCMHDFDGNTGFDLYSRLNTRDRQHFSRVINSLLACTEKGEENNERTEGDHLEGAHTIHLKPYQQRAIENLKSGMILCAGTGVGKSITALAYYYIMVCRGVVWNGCELGPMMEPKPLYIITTAMKRDKGDWDEELARFGLSTGGAGGGGDTEAEVVVDSWNNLHKYTDAEDAFFIFDEQRVVGKGEWVKSFYKVAKKNEWILLTATPGDSWLDYIPVFVANGFYKNRSQFLSRHATYIPYITQYPAIDKKKWREVGYMEFLRRKITYLMKAEKHTKQHWKNIVVGYDREKYEKIAKDRWDPWKDEPIPDISGACYLMRRASGTHDTEGMANYHPYKLNTRALELAHLIYEKHPKLIIFYNYDYELEAMKEVFSKCNGEIGFYSGEKRFAVAEWNGHKHEPIPEGKSWAYLVQYSAGAEGWNCIETDAMAFYSMNYSYKAMTQAAGRIDRANTPYEDLYYYILKSDAPIDKAVEAALKDKQTFNEALFWSKEMN